MLFIKLYIFIKILQNKVPSPFTHKIEIQAAKLFSIFDNNQKCFLSNDEKNYALHHRNSIAFIIY